MQNLQKLSEQLEATRALLETIMGQFEEVNALLDRVDKATTATAARIKKILEGVQPGITPEQADSLKARLGAEVASLEALGADGVESVPLDTSSPTTGQ